MDSNNKISNIAVCYCLKYLTQVSYSRWVQTVHQSVLKYCLIETDPLTASRSFRYPTSEVSMEVGMNDSKFPDLLLVLVVDS